MSFPLEIRGLCKRYEAGAGGCLASAQALRAVDLVVAPGEIVALAGGPGAGKSTLLLCAAGLLRPDAGLVLHHGVPAPLALARGGRVVYAGAGPGPAAGVEAPPHPRALLLLDHPVVTCLARAAGLLAQLGAFARAGGAAVLALRDAAALAELRALGPRVVTLRDGRLPRARSHAVRRAPVPDAHARVAEPEHARRLPPTGASQRVGGRTWHD